MDGTTMSDSAGQQDDWNKGPSMTPVMSPTATPAQILEFLEIEKGTEVRFSADGEGYEVAKIDPDGALHLKGRRAPVYPASDWVRV